MASSSAVDLMLAALPLMHQIVFLNMDGGYITLCLHCLHCLHRAFLGYNLVLNLVELALIRLISHLATYRMQ